MIFNVLIMCRILDDLTCVLNPLLCSPTVTLTARCSGAAPYDTTCCLQQACCLFGPLVTNIPVTAKDPTVVGNALGLELDDPKTLNPTIR